MFWKIQSGIVPPFFYVIIGEKEKLKLLRNLLCPERQNTVQPVDQANMVCTVTNVQQLTISSKWKFHFIPRHKMSLFSTNFGICNQKTRDYFRLLESTAIVMWSSSYFNANFAWGVCYLWFYHEHFRLTLHLNRALSLIVQNIIMK